MMMNAIVNEIKKNFPPGTRVVLDEMHDEYRNLEPGTEGIVKCVDDIGTIHVNWNCGSSLGVVNGIDQCHRIP